MRSKKKTKRWMETQSRSDLKPGCVIETFDNTPTPERSTTETEYDWAGDVSDAFWNDVGSEDGNGYQACYGRQVLCTNSSKLKMSFTYIALYDPTNYEAMIRVLRDMNPAAILELRASPLGQAVTDQRIWDFEQISQCRGDTLGLGTYGSITYNTPQQIADDGKTYDPRCSGSLCGNGVIDIDGFNQEECDDGNDDPTDGCTNECKLATCGDGIVHAGVEECDDGNTYNTDACTNECKIAVCGDGYVHVGREDCDDSNEEACLDNCKYDREYQIQEKYAGASTEEKEIYEEVFKTQVC